MTLHSRSKLHAPDTLRWVMDHPGNGTPFTVRSLAKAAQCQPATIGHLLAGRYRRTEKETADRIADALGCTPATLFAPEPSMDPDDPSM